MKFEVKIAKNGEYTLSLNNINIYSTYNPRQDAKKFILQEYDENAEGYFLIGLGLGYHLEQLVTLNSKKKIEVLILDEKEIDFFYQFSSNAQIISAENVQLIKDWKVKSHLLNYQLFIPLPIMKALGHEHSLYHYLEDIKINQMSHKRFESLLEENFRYNIMNGDSSINIWHEKFQGESAFLVSAGPSLEDTLITLEKVQKQGFVLCVGSALNVLLAKNIIPNAIIITDPSPLVVKQISESNYKGILFYLATANYEMTLRHTGNRFIMFQKGYFLSEEFAKNNVLTVLETGGSVATTALSLLEYMGFKSVYLFGQDFGFKGTNTHAVNSTSNNSFRDTTKFRKVIANSGEYLSTRADLNSFRRWFERKVSKTNLEIFNTAWKGARIEGVPYIDNEELLDRLM
ncbi:motility associated factor glycosyltransferase family protein [Psychrobacillus sp. FJAT-21963]|uniref:motility associated factor glycosyltransferase family protein n=1 Tax=Psychrobacillus sp. FJAT-21963 TaxID=1712028 RepID=UPI0006FE4B9A|nr:6-hydroxymethylpterin diphosphokinase MptE-like protein [Psychrobacillus sp. FJAT-21963]KQL36753.1 hypothetical protein AN959_01405 [Psychrobacillus sp. FJAT-21963]